MDAHYTQVMNARKQAAAGGPRLYFAYSTILDREAFEEWREEHSYQFFELPAGKIGEAQDVDLIYDFASRWWGGRVAGLIDKPGAKVFGRVFEISGENWPVVQHKEGAITGACVERAVKVEIDGQLVDAIAFTTNPQRATDQGPVSQDFVEALTRGATAAGLPADYVARLRATAR